MKNKKGGAKLLDTQSFKKKRTSNLSKKIQSFVDHEKKKGIKWFNEIGSDLITENTKNAILKKRREELNQYEARIRKSILDRQVNFLGKHPVINSEYKKKVLETDIWTKILEPDPETEELELKQAEKKSMKKSRKKRVKQITPKENQKEKEQTTPKNKPKKQTPKEKKRPESSKKKLSEKVKISKKEKKAPPVDSESDTEDILPTKKSVPIEEKFSETQIFEFQELMKSTSIIGAKNHEYELYSQFTKTPPEIFDNILSGKEKIKFT